MVSVIINADDFGLSPAVNRGIVSAYREGVLTSTTLLANLPFFSDAVELARQNPDLPMGAHLSLLWGRPVSDPREVPTLVDPAGAFPTSLGVLVRRYFLGRLSADQVRTEFRAQLRKLTDAGVRPTHVDTHKHVHCLPGILEATVAVAREFGIDRLRHPYEVGVVRRRAAEPASSAPRPAWKARLKRNAVRYLCRDGRAVLARCGMRTTDHFVGIDYANRLDANTLRFILENLRSGVTELMCHPGYDDEHARAYSRTPPDREVELAALKDRGVRDHLEALGLKRASYRDI